MTTIPATLEEQITTLFWAVADDKRRARNRKRTGKVSDVDHEKGLYRVELNQGGQYAPMKTPWIRMRETSMGSIKTHYPVSVGQQVVVESENGDLTDAEIVTSLFSDENQRPSTSGDECIPVKIGDTTVMATGDKVTITTGTFEVHAGAVKFIKA